MLSNHFRTNTCRYMQACTQKLQGHLTTVYLKLQDCLRRGFGTCLDPKCHDQRAACKLRGTTVAQKCLQGYGYKGNTAYTIEFAGRGKRHSHEGTAFGYLVTHVVLQSMQILLRRLALCRIHTFPCSMWKRNILHGSSLVFVIIIYFLIPYCIGLLVLFSCQTH